MEIVQDSAVRFQCPAEFAQKITRYIDKAEVLTSSSEIADVVVYWGIDEMQRLARLAPSSIKIPSPIERDYHWPGMFTPFAHQKDTSRFLTLHRRAFCFNEAGTGKTSAAIWAAEDRKSTRLNSSH